MDFAFFVTHFGYTKADYNQLTYRDKVFITKAYEDMVVSWTTYIRNAVLNGVSNALRKKNQSFRPLWKKTAAKADKAVIQDNLHTILQIEQNEKEWIDKIRKGV